MNLYKKFLKHLIAVFLLFVIPVQAAEFKNRKVLFLKVGQSKILKGIRGDDCGNSAPSWIPTLNGLPETKLGSYSDGGAGFVKSRSCGGRVGARGILYTAEKPGKEELTIYKDKIRITVK